MYPFSMPGYPKELETDDDCRENLVSLRWPDGFVCPECKSQDSRVIGKGRFLCKDCGNTTTVTASTAFDRNRDLVNQFKALWIFVDRPFGIDANGLTEELGVTAKTARRWLKKFVEFAKRVENEKLSGQVYIFCKHLLDDMYKNKNEEFEYEKRFSNPLIAFAVEHSRGKISRIKIGQILTAAQNEKFFMTIREVHGELKSVFELQIRNFEKVKSKSNNIKRLLGEPAVDEETFMVESTKDKYFHYKALKLAKAKKEKLDSYYAEMDELYENIETLDKQIIDKLEERSLKKVHKQEKEVNEKLPSFAQSSVSEGTEISHMLMWEFKQTWRTDELLVTPSIAHLFTAMNKFFFPIRKRKVGTENLYKYLDEFVFRYNHWRKPSGKKFEILLQAGLSSPIDT